MNINKLYDIFNVNTLHVFNEGDISDTAHIQSVVHFFLHWVSKSGLIEFISAAILASSMVG